MRDACGELADELELLRLQQPGFSLLPARRLGFQRVRLRAQLLDVRPTRRHHSRRGDHGEGEAQEREPEQERLELLGVDLARAQKRRLVGVEIDEEVSYLFAERFAFAPRKRRHDGRRLGVRPCRGAIEKPLIRLDQAVDLVDPLDLARIIAHQTARLLDAVEQGPPCVAIGEERVGGRAQDVIAERDLRILKALDGLPGEPADFVGVFDPVRRLVDPEGQNGREHRGENEQTGAADGQDEAGAAGPIGPQPVDRMGQAREKRRGHPDCLQRRCDGRRAETRAHERNTTWRAF